MAQLTAQQRAGYRGEAFVAKVVADAGFIWNERSKDFGIDGQIELVDRSGQLTGAKISVQVKSTETGYRVNEVAGTATFTCEKSHIDYWMTCPEPVILVFVDLEGQRAWWKRLDTWFADPHRRMRRVVELTIAADAFDAETCGDLAPVCVPDGRPLPRLRDTETLMSNLLEVTSFASRIQSADSTCRERGEAWERMRSNAAFEGGFDLSNGRIHTLGSLDRGPLAVLVKGAVSSTPTESWSETDDLGVQKQFVRLLNYTLRAMHHTQLVWHPKKRIVYYQAPDDLRRERVRGRSSRGAGRSFFMPYMGRDEVEKVSFCRHYAADLRFRRWMDRWYLEITPEYHFTRDGKRDSLYDADYVSRIKRIERNHAVRQLVVAWADFLRGEDDNLFSTRDDRIVFGELLTVEADARINEKLWLPQRGADPSADPDTVTDELWALS